MRRSAPPGRSRASRDRQPRVAARPQRGVGVLVDGGRQHARRRAPRGTARRRCRRRRTRGAAARGRGTTRLIAAPRRPRRAPRSARGQALGRADVPEAARRRASARERPPRGQQAGNTSRSSDAAPVGGHAGEQRAARTRRRRRSTHAGPPRAPSRGTRSRRPVASNSTRAARRRVVDRIAGERRRPRRLPRARASRSRGRDSAQRVAVDAPGARPCPVAAAPARARRRCRAARARPTTRSAQRRAPRRRRVRRAAASAPWPAQQHDVGHAVRRQPLELARRGTGRPPSGASALGRSPKRPASRVPSPPASTKPVIGSAPVAGRGVEVRGEAHRPVGLARGLARDHLAEQAHEDELDGEQHAAPAPNSISGRTRSGSPCSHSADEVQR